MRKKRRSLLSLPGLKVLIILIIFIFIYALLNSVMTAAGNTKIFEGQVRDGGVAATSYGNFTLSFSKDKKSIALSNKGEGAVVGIGECKNSNLYRFCYNGKKDAGHDYQRDIEIYKAQVSIYLIGPSVSVEHLFEPPLIPAQSSRGVIRLINRGSGKAENLVYQAVMPSFSMIKKANTSNIEIYQNTIHWEGFVDGDSVKDVDFLFMPLKKTDYNATWRINYTFSTKKYSNNGTFNVKTGEPFSLTLSVPNNVGVGGSFNITASFKNNYEGFLYIKDFSLKIPQGITLEKSPLAYSESHTDNGMSVFSLEAVKIEGGATAQYIFTLKAISAGKKTIYFDAGSPSFSGSEVDYRYAVNKSVQAGLSNISLSINLPSNFIVNGESVPFSILIRNPNTKTSFKNVRAETYGAAPYSSNELLTLGEGSNETITKGWIRPNNVKIVTKRWINVTLTYYSEDGKKFVGHYAAPLTFSPRESGLKVTRKYTGELRAGGNITMSVWIENLGNHDTVVSAEESLPYDFMVVEGTTKNTLAIKSKEKVFFYSYKIHIPFKTANKKRVITTEMKDLKEEYTTSNSKEYTIASLPKPEVGITSYYRSPRLFSDFNISINLKNKDKRAIEDVVVSPEIKEGFAYVKPTERRIKRINPGENKTVVLRLRILGVKETKSRELSGLVLKFNDEYGNTYTSGINAINIRINGSSSEKRGLILSLGVENATYKGNNSLQYSNGCYLVREGSKIALTLNITNPSEEDAEGMALLKSNQELLKSSFFSLSTGTRRIGYTLSAGMNMSVRAEADYSFNDENSGLLSSSNGICINVKKIGGPSKNTSSAITVNETFSKEEKAVKEHNENVRVVPKNKNKNKESNEEESVRTIKVKKINKNSNPLERFVSAILRFVNSIVG